LQGITNYQNGHITLGDGNIHQQQSRRMADLNVQYFRPDYYPEVEMSIGGNVYTTGANSGVDI